LEYRDTIGTPLFDGACKILLLGAGELGKEIVIEAQRLGVETITIDRYDRPPAAQVAHRHYTVDMKDGRALKAIVRREKPDAIVPEVEAVDTEALLELEEEGFFVAPRARAAKVTFDRVLLRQLADEEAKVSVPPYAFAYSLEELYEACDKVGYPCLVKARMSSGGLGSSVVSDRSGVSTAYENAKKMARGFGEHVIVEGIVDFDLELTELTLAHIVDGRVQISFCKPVGHVRSGSHYHVSWQPFTVIDEGTGLSRSPLRAQGGEFQMREDTTRSEVLWSSPWDGKRLSREQVEEVERQAYDIAGRVVSKLIESKAGLAGLGIFGCELFVKLSDERYGGRPKVYFNEVSPRPHDTGMVTMVTQEYSEMTLHVRSILRLPIPRIQLLTPGASHVILAHKDGAWAPKFAGLAEALKVPGVTLRLFGKPVTYLERRLGVALAAAADIEDARINAMQAAHIVESSIHY